MINSASYSIMPQLEVGILFANEIRFRLNGRFTCLENGRSYSGSCRILRNREGYCLIQAARQENVSLPITFQAENSEISDFDLTDVVIGIDFHWERKENQKFKGALKIIDEGKHLTAINILPLEEYLLSVISSEMSATSSLEFLKAHAVISRSWLLAQLYKSSHLTKAYSSCQESPEEYIRWYDREDHAHFDVCADDHCQRYQGISKAYTPAVQKALEATRGEVLTYAGEICDARFSKCCGGVTERFENTWEPVVHPYLDRVYDAADPTDCSDLRDEQAARQWILSSPPVFCNTDDQEILSQILHDYDQETRHFFRWQVRYTRQELSELVHRKLGIDFGEIQEILPIERGVSGRLIRVKIIGTKKSLIIGKELLIRKAFSETHLYSSAFIVDTKGDEIIFHGAGWGHGVGLCQIGAAVMGARGYDYQTILQHYFKGCKLVKLYE